MISTILYILFFLSCVVLVATILLQPGKADAGALFTSNISSTAFGPRGTQTILSKITITAATTFMLSALLLAMPALTGDVSVLQTTTADSSTETKPAADAANSNTSANTTVTVDSNANAAPAGNTANAQPTIK